MNVVTYGTFDLFHYGHLNLLVNARKMGSKLFVGLSTDDFNKIKGKDSFHNYDERRTNLLEVRAVTEIFAERSWDQKIDDIERYNIDVFVMGDDWSGKFDFLKPVVKVIYLPRTRLISSSLIKAIL